MNALTEEVQPFSVYLQLEQGEKADLEVVSRAAIELVAAIKELAFYLDPTLDVRVELARGNESSLDLWNWLRAKKARPRDRLTLLAIALGIGGFLGQVVGTDIYHASPLHAWIQGHPDDEISDAELQKIIQEVKKATVVEPVRSHVQSFYREIDRDNAIVGVGSSAQIDKRPSVIVPKSQFRSRSGIGDVIETTERERERTAVETVILVSPILLQSDRKWKFRSGYGEFGASIDDDKFLGDVLSGRRTFPMIAGLQMDVEMKTIEEMTPEGLWKPIDRHVLRVLDMRKPPSQVPLDLTPPSPEEDNDDQR